MSRFLRLVTFAIVAILFIGQSDGAQAVERVAVVVGNQDYEVISDLSNARADAQAMTTLLRDLGFTVFDGYDVDRETFERLIRASMLNVDAGAEIVFFYAGHGIQIGRRNYLLPVDVAFSSIYDLPAEAITLDRVIDVLSARGTVHVAIIDACRENPFPDIQLAGGLDASLYETRQGFDFFQPPLNSFVAFSTYPGMVAYDGTPGGNSPYTAAIVETVEAAPDQNVTDLFARVREQVHHATEGRQVPSDISTLVRPFRFLSAETSLREGQTQEPKQMAVLGGDAETDVAQGVVEPPKTQSGSSADRAGDSGSKALPKALSLQVQYDREISLGSTLVGEVGLEALPPLRVAEGEGPKRGIVDVSGGGLTYIPTLSERRSEGMALMLADGFTLIDESGNRMSVTLEMDVNACDLAAGDALDPGGVGLYRLPNEIPVEAALQACMAAVEASPDEPRFRYQLGRAQLASTDFEAAFQSFQAAAVAGHVRALNSVARLLTATEIDRDLTPIPEDRPRAFALLEEGIAAADPFAMHQLGTFLLRGGETDAERERGFELLDRAAELGHTYSMNELGVYFMTPGSKHYLPERGERYLEASAARGDIYGFHNMGFIHLRGLIGEPDYAVAYDWFERAALGGHPRSPATLGRMIVRGQVAVDLREAVKWYDMGLERGDPWGGVNAASLILSDEVSGFSEAEALVRAVKALNLPGDSEAKDRAAALIKEAADADLGRAIQLLLNELGAGVSVDGVIGQRTRDAIAARAAEAGVAVPQGSLADLLAGVGLIFRAENPIRSDLY